MIDIRPPQAVGKEMQGLLPQKINDLMMELLPVYGLYRAAAKEMCTRLEVLDDEFQMQYQRNPIHHMQSRLKSPASIVSKLERRELPKTLQTALDNLTDIAGIRVICSYVDDVYALAHLIEAQDDIELLRKTDYIAQPKPNGYRSLHLVVHVPVYLSEGKRYAPVEIQIRTIAMDFWASLEHDLKYKAGDDVDATIAQELMECGHAIAAIDLKMQAIAQKVQRLAQERHTPNLPDLDLWEPLNY